MNDMAADDRKNILSLIAKEKLVWPFLLFILYFVSIYAIQPAFFSSNNLGSLVYYACLLVPAVLGVHLLMVLGLFDLSVGAVAATAGIASAIALSAGYSIPVSIFVGCIPGLIFGLINWVLVSKLRIPALIGTLITMGAARACALALSQGQVIGGLPNHFGEIVLSTATIVSPAIIIGLILVLLIEVLSRRQVIFRRLYHVGSNRSAAISSGINVGALECMGFLLCSLGAALTGILQSSRTLSASPLVFPDLALECIAACVIGGTALSGGKGRPVGAFIGMFIVVMSRNLAVLAGVGVYWKELAIAVVLLAAVLLNRSEKQ
jgi:ribose transport system permease protein